MLNSTFARLDPAQQHLITIATAHTALVHLYVLKRSELMRELASLGCLDDLELVASYRDIHTQLAFVDGIIDFHTQQQKRLEEQ